MLRVFTTLTLCSLLVTACAGSAYRLPPVSDTDIQAMQKKISSHKTSLRPYKRSDQQYKKIVARITGRLEKNIKPLCDYAEYQSCYFQVGYVADNTFNAYASEGYKISIHRGLLQYLKNEDEVAAVIAHEMGHHLANHNEETLQNAQAGAAISGILTAVLIGAANANNPYYSSYQQQQDQRTLENMMHAGAEIGAISYSKEQEREADLLSTYILSRAGFNLERAQNMMLVLSEYSGEGDTDRAAFLDSHPAGIERFVAWDKAVKEVKNNPSKLPYIIEQPKKQTSESDYN